jgi:hypothetical protein
MLENTNHHLQHAMMLSDPHAKQFAHSLLHDLDAQTILFIPAESITMPHLLRRTPTPSPYHWLLAYTLQATAGQCKETK